jgi:cytochrome c oxidase accessory protein FixG
VANAPASGESLYRKEPKIYPRHVTGRFARLRVISVWVLLGLYYLLPWINIGGHQSVLFDLPARKFYILGITFWPQDFIYLALILIIAGLSLFFFTALAGRLWCGFACPQTVWTEVFVMIERWFEGDRQKRIKLDKAAWSREKILRKTGKQAAWILFAAWTGFTFVGFFTPMRELSGQLMSWTLGPWEGFWMVFYSIATYGNAGFLREQVCKYMCPYARFQSAMYDKDTLVISYDEERGEPRGGRRKNADIKEAGLGSCINCTLCVQVCPTGIDIRDGLQYECIACAACIDVCDQVMDKMDYPRGLIRFTTEHALKHKQTKVIRPRLLIYAVLLVVIIVSTFWSMSHRTPLRADLIRDRNALYRELPGGLIENVYTLKITNMDDAAHQYEFILPSGTEAEIDTSRPLFLQAEEVAGISVRIRMPATAGQGVQHLDLELRAEDDPSIMRVIEAKVLLPVDFGSK